MKNILYGRPTASEIEVWKAAEDAYLKDVIEDLAARHSHRPGNAGNPLVRWAKTAGCHCPRHFTQSVPSFLLDEATNALDAESEQLVQRSLKQPDGFPEQRLLLRTAWKRS